MITIVSPVITDPPAEPQTPDEWQEAVDAAELLLHIVSAEAFGLLVSTLEINIERGDDVLAAGHERGITPRVVRYLGAECRPS